MTTTLNQGRLKLKKLLKLGVSALAISLAANAASAEGKLVIYN